MSLNLGMWWPATSEHVAKLLPFTDFLLQRFCAETNPAQHVEIIVKDDKMMIN